MANFTTIQSTTHACTQNVEFSVVKNATFNSGSPQATSGYARIWIDATALVAGDVMEIRVYRSIGGGTLTADDLVTLRIGQIWTRDLGLLVGNWDATVKITTATTRTIGFEASQDTNDVNAATAGSSAVTSIQSGLALSATALSTAQWTNARAAELDNLDVASSTRAPSSTALSTAQWTNARAALQDNIDVATSTRAPSSTALNTAQWTNALAAALLAADLTKLDTAVSTRAPSVTAVLNTDLTAVRAAKLDNIDAATSSRAAASTALSTAQWTNTRAGNLDSVDAAVSSRATSGSVAGVQSDTTSLLGRLTSTRAGLLDSLASVATAGAVSALATAVAALPDAGTVAAAVWNTISEGTETVMQALRIIVARAAGGGTVRDGDGLYTFPSRDGSKTRIGLNRAGNAITVATRDGT